MAKSKPTRKELLKGTDEFLTLTERGIRLFQKHMRVLKYIGLGIAVVIVAYLAGYTYLDHVNEKGQEAYNKAYDQLVKNMKPGADPETWQQSEKLFKQVVDDTGLSQAARLALPQIAYINFQQKDYDKSLQNYKEFGQEISREKNYEYLCLLAEASCYEAKGQYQESIRILQPLVETKVNPFRETAMLSLERVYRLDNQAEKAHKVLQEFVDTYKTSPFFDAAKARL